ncbi:Pkinase-domain-containing protein [Guyanagaster necrorhizus]|uniref:[RNA-polymerase]-subunit kinase n=1 Tax=Guyanagaster necrorhizus TaxID=856835 RepID=A0A9P7VYP4_9AGAR|nr:Pkinase-domain-containing protein [Guyanagaster necrorhizus MCA 3950]KAG7449170.1 Pkinase-domain-containing protein [Guyanagaster necrorhizus MCA 3950]
MDVSPDVLAAPRSQELSHDKQSSALRVTSQDTSIHTPQGGGVSPTEEPDRRRSRSQPSRPSDPRSPPAQPSRQSVDPRIRREDLHTADLELVSKPQTPPVDEDQFGVDTDKPLLAGSSRDGSYTIVSQVGEGTFGKVYKAQNIQTGVHVALKRIRMESEKDGFPVTAMREIKLLQSLRHANVVRLYEILVSSGAVYMVFEYMDHDLTGILSQSQFSFSDAHLKSLCHQMLAGLSYLHHKGVIHRDIKGSNILINNRGELKLGDFGLARFYQKRRRTDYTNRVITLWYRPPELLFGATVYGPEVDMWSAGCIMLELFTKKPVFQGNDEIHQLDVIYRILGTPTQDRWPDIINLPWYELVKPKDPVANRFRELFQKWMSPAALDLAEQLLAYDPSKRASAVQAMEAPYFESEQPEAERPLGLANLEGEWHELETKRERAKKRKKE